MAVNISCLKNIGPKTEKWLLEVGITTVEKLRKTPLDKIYYELKGRGFPVNMTFVYALDCGLKGEHWLSISEERKSELKSLISKSKFMRPEDCIKSLQSLTNIGKQMSIYLYEIGIKSPAQFKEMPFEEIWDKLVRAYPKIAQHSAYKMAVLGAYEDKPWSDIDLKHRRNDGSCI